MTSPFRTLLHATAVVLLPLSLLPAQDPQKHEPPPEEPAIEPRALEIITRASEFLSGAKQFAVTAEVSQDLVGEKGSKLQMCKQVELKVRRPDRLQVHISTTVPKRTFWYDGKTISLLDHQKNYYGVSPAPGKIDGMVDQVEKDLGVVFPLDDLVRAKPLAGPASKAGSGVYLGVDKVLGRPCHHVAFSHEAIDWQAWVEDGPKPLLRKLVITFKLDEGSPQYTALLTHWDLGTKLPDFVFKFEPPDGAQKIEFLPAKPEPAEPATDAGAAKKPAN